MDYQTILFAREGGVATITLNRPGAFNAENEEMLAELVDALIACHVDDTIRAVLLTGAGGAFCAGGDVKLMTEHLDRSPSVFFRNFAIRLHAVTSGLTRLPKPTIAAVNGAAAGAGFALALACDVTLASDKARFTVAYGGIGLAPDGGTTFLLPRLFGPKKALELIYTNRTITAQEAFEQGLINAVVPADELMVRAADLAAQLAEGPTFAFGKAKHLVYSGLADSLETQLENERQALAETGATADFREGALAFKEKRKPRFSGR